MPLPIANCDFCTLPFNDKLDRCPHCARPSRFPNVIDASRAGESEALRLRYVDAVRVATVAGAEAALAELQTALATSAACKAVKHWCLGRLIESDSEFATTYYAQLDAGSRGPDLPTDRDWDRLRRVADGVAFTSYYKDIHFAALTVDQQWPTNYGDCVMFFREELIAHRTTVFEDNTTTWIQSQSVDWATLGEGATWEVPAGHRAPWVLRSELVVAKLAPQLTPGMANPSSLVLQSGATSAGDSLIEVHIFGRFTIRTVGELRVQTRVLSDFARRCLDDGASRYGYKWSECP